MKPGARMPPPASTLSASTGTAVAGVFTRSKCPSAPVDYCRQNLAAGKARVLVVNSGNANAFTGKVAMATGTAGAGDPDLSAALAALGDDPFDWIATPFADATNLGRYKALLSDISGRWAWNRQVYGHVFFPATDTVANLTTAGLAQDDRHLTMIPRPATGLTPQPAWQWAAAFAARIVPWLADGSTGNVSRNQTGLAIEGIAPPRDRSKWYGYATRDAFLRSGVSTWSVDQAGRVLVDKAITMQRTTLGVPDTTFRDVQKMGQLVYALRKFRTDRPSSTARRRWRTTIPATSRQCRRRGISPRRSCIPTSPWY